MGKYRRKFEYYDLNEGMIVLGHSLSKKEALNLIHRREKRQQPDLSRDEMFPAEDIKPIYELTYKISGADDGYYSWKNKPTSESDIIIGWVVTV